MTQWAADGVRLRTRALITTLFARLFLGDTFLHGIGGAKYDQVTDLLIERFFGLRPPCYMTLTATLRLPIDGQDAAPADARSIDAQLRELAYHPERYLDAQANGAAETLVRQKREWIDTPATRENARLRCHKIIEANTGLQPFVAGQRRELLARRDHASAAQRAHNILASREYAFCLYPADALRRLMEVPAE